MTGGSARQKIGDESHGHQPRKKALVVCGPTAAGKSGLADSVAERLTENHGGSWVPTVAVDSMQVYREIPEITNQARRRPAELVGVVSVADEWTVARHRESVDKLVKPLDTPFVLDAGTGMYLNAVVLAFALAPAAPANIRSEAQRLAAGAENPRRAARSAELELMAASPRGSVWSGNLRYDAAFIYLKPSRDLLDRNIEKRTAKILHDGFEEAQDLLESGITPNSSVRQAVGVKEMLLYASGAIDSREAQDRINARTRRLARRQMRWFDKLARMLPPEARIVVAEDDQDAWRTWYRMHATIWA